VEEVMRRIRRRDRPSRRSVWRSEGGFAMIEVIVSAVLLVVLSLATARIIDESGKRSGIDRSRGVASSVAKADQDRLRALQAGQLYNFVTNTRVVPVEGINYSVTSAVELARDSGVVGCSTSGNTARADYFRITSTVTWPTMGNTKPVALGSIVSPGVADNTRGSLTVQINNEAGVGVQGVGVNAAGLSATTNAAGCVVFGNLAAGTYPVTWTKPGYVDRTGSPTGGKSATVSGAANASISDNYDLAATIPVNIKGTDGTTQTWPKMTLESAPNLAQRTFAYSTAPTSGGSLYPFSAGYTSYAGGCDANDPGSAFYTANAGTSIVAGPGATTTALTAYLRKISISFTATGGTAPKYRITPNMTGCSEGDSGVLTGSSGTLYYPWGTYTYCEQATFGSTTKKLTAALTNTPSGVVTSMAALSPGVNITSTNTTNGTC
jgi:Tfp pilus assembly protein PilV